MRCLNCRAFALLSFCDLCELELGEFSLSTRKLEGDFKVYSFYKYHEIQYLLRSKHHFYGYFVYNILAKLSFAKFQEFFNPQIKINAIALDDKVENRLYSHSAILAKHLKPKIYKTFI